MDNPVSNFIDGRSGHAPERVFLRKVGGGYIFTHRLLMEYFATLEPTKQAGEGHPAAEAKPTEVGPVA
jgi:hypothetical protein